MSRDAIGSRRTRPRLGLRPGVLLGVRAVAEATGLDGREVAALLRAGYGDEVAAMVSVRQVDQLERAWPTERHVDWSALIAQQGRT